jgi:Flp pilus assembly protein TadG
MRRNLNLRRRSASRRSASRRAASRRAAMIILFAVLLPVILVICAVVVELVRLRHVKSQLQATADAGALAGAARLRITSSELETTTFSLSGEGSSDIRPTVQAVVAKNTVAHLSPISQYVEVLANWLNDTNGDIVLGNFTSQGFNVSTSVIDAVKVTVRFQAGHPNGLLPLFFGTILTRSHTEFSATAIAGVERPTLLPFLVYQPQWDFLMAGNGLDLFSVDVTTHTVTSAPDGIFETAVFPNDWDGLNMPPGNFGWFQLGPDSDTTTIIRQLDAGPNEADMAYFGGQLSAGDFVSGVTGMRTATDVGFLGGEYNGTTYAGILGKPRLIALYDYATGNGKNAQFRITKFVLARVVFADLTGQGLGVVIQPITQNQDPNKVRLLD